MAVVTQRMQMRRSQNGDVAEFRHKTDTSHNKMPKFAGAQRPQNHALREVVSWLTGAKAFGQLDLEDDPSGSVSANNCEELHNPHGVKVDSAVRFLGFVGAASELLAHVLPPNAANLCCALTVSKIIDVCADIAEAGHECHERYKEHVEQPAADQVDHIRAAGKGLGAAMALKARNKDLVRNTVNLVMTVALPALLMHSIEKSGWDMLTDMPSVMDALQGAAGQLAHAMHVADVDSVQYFLAQAVPSIAGSFLLPLIVRPAEQAAQQHIEDKFRPALDEFLRSHSHLCSLSFTKSLSSALTSLRLSPSALASELDRGAQQSFLSGTLSATHRLLTQAAAPVNKCLWQSYTSLNILFHAVAGRSQAVQQARRAVALEAAQGPSCTSSCLLNAPPSPSHSSLICA